MGENWGKSGKIEKNQGKSEKIGKKCNQPEKIRKKLLRIWNWGKFFPKTNLLSASFIEFWYIKNSLLLKTCFMLVIRDRDM